MKPRRALFAMATLCAASLLPGAWRSAAAQPQPGTPDSAPAVAMLRYAGGKTGECFGKRFLARFGEATDAEAAKLDSIQALDLDPATHPVALLTGEGRFRLAEGEADALRRFVAAGGLLVASTGCSDPGWSASFEAALPELLAPGLPPLGPLPAGHPALARVFRVDTSAYAKGPPRLPVLRGSHRADGRLAVVWSPEGLNDTLGVEDSNCCCCGGNEVRSAEQILVNLLAIGFDAEPVGAPK